MHKMKKIFLLIIAVFLAIIICFYMNYKELMIEKNDAKKFNSEYEFYNKESILGTDITTIINKAINNNQKYSISKDENGLYIPDEENSIKIYIHMISNETTYPMESFVARSLEDFTRFFGQVSFKCTDVKYHSKTGKISEMTFTSDEY